MCKSSESLLFNHLHFAREKNPVTIMKTSQDYFSQSEMESQKVTTWDLRSEGSHKFFRGRCVGSLLVVDFSCDEVSLMWNYVCFFFFFPQVLSY